MLFILTDNKSKDTKLEGLYNKYKKIKIKKAVAKSYFCLLLLVKPIKEDFII